MEIINHREYYLSKKRIRRFLSLFEKSYRPRTIIIYEKRIDVLRNIRPVGLSVFGVLLGRTEGLYILDTDTVCVFVFSENDDGDDRQSFQLYSLHALCHELRHRFQYKTGRPMTEEDADAFATLFMKTHAHAIKKIMGWADEWEVEEY